MTLFSMSSAQLAPKVQVSVNQKPLSSSAMTDLLRVAVSEDVDAPGMFTLELQSFDLIRGQLTWVDDALFDCGTPVEIQMGYENNLQRLISGEITGLEPEFGPDEVPRLVVRGYDLRHRLLRGRKTRSFTQVTDSDIANTIALEHKLSLKKYKNSATEIQFEYVLQNNQTNLAFLQERAKRLGYEVNIVDTLLTFEPPQYQSSNVVQLQAERDLLEFSPCLSILNLVNEVEVQGWDVQAKASLLGKAQVGNESTALGKTSGPKASQSAFGKAQAAIVTQPIRSQAEADQMAQAQFDAMAMTYITGEGSCLGNPAVRAGQLINITGIGKRFSGRYYVAAANHTYSSDQGYRTQFTVRRNAA